MMMIPWPLFLFLAVGGIEKMGGVISAGLVVGTIVTFLTGYLSDTGKKGKIITIGSRGLSVVGFVRMILTHALAVASSHAIAQAFRDSFLVAWTSKYYQLVRSAKIPGEFVLGQGVVDHLSRIVVLIPVMFLAYVLPISQFFITSFVIAGVASFLYVFATKQSK